MSEDTKQLIILMIGIILFLAMLIGSLTYNSVNNEKTQRICLEQGYNPKDC